MKISLQADELMKCEMQSEFRAASVPLVGMCSVCYVSLWSAARARERVAQ